MSVQKEKVDRNIELLLCYLSNNSNAEIGRRHDLSETTVKRVVNKTLLKMWEYLRKNKIPHPYGPTYPHAYHGTFHHQNFRPRNLVKSDIVNHKEWWIEQILKYKQSI